MNECSTSKKSKPVYMGRRDKESQGFKTKDVQ